MNTPNWIERRARSLRFRDRLAIATAAAVAIAVLLASILVFIAVRNELRRRVDDSLVARAVAIRSASGGTDMPFIDSPPFGGPGGYTQYVRADGKVFRPPRVTASIPVSRPALRVAERGAGVHFYSTTVAGTHVRVVTVPWRGGFALQVARPLDEIDVILGRLGWVMLLVGAGGIALAASLGTAVARMALAPVDRLTSAAEQVARTRDPSRTIEVEGSDELARLATSFNTMLEALDDSLRAQRQLVADASHELRTPLTSLRTNIEVLARADALPDAEREQLLRDVIAQLDDFTTLIGDLVDLARGDEPAQTQEEVPLAHIVLHEVERARSNYKGVDFDLDVEQVVVTGVPSRIARAVSNLLDNACKWSSAGSKVTVQVRGKEVTVRDAGPGIAEQDLPYVFDRFYRAPAARQLPGSGLGLSIVRQTMQAHGGTAIAENHPDGGAVLTLRFP